MLAVLPYARGTMNAMYDAELKPVFFQRFLLVLLCHVKTYHQHPFCCIFSSAADRCELPVSDSLIAAAIDLQEEPTYDVIAANKERTDETKALEKNARGVEYENTRDQQCDVVEGTTYANARADLDDETVDNIDEIFYEIPRAQGNDDTNDLGQGSYENPAFSP
jgi:hypothetical protein